MVDYRFHDIVIESHSMIGPVGEYHTAVCTKCSTKHKITIEDFDYDSLYRLVPQEDGFYTRPANPLDRNEDYKEVLRYVAEMRAWNCCYEGEEPIDGFPNEPDTDYVDFGQ